MSLIDQMKDLYEADLILQAQQAWSYDIWAY